MARPSRQIDQALLHSGGMLYPQLGYAQLSVRTVAEHAQVAPGMFHYHFASKEVFVRQLLQRQYDMGFAQLQQHATSTGPVLQRLQHALALMACFVRDHHAWVFRVISDASLNIIPVQDFLKSNAPRHVLVMLALLEEAERMQAIAPQPALERLSFVMGAVVAPCIVLPHVMRYGVMPSPITTAVPAQVLSDAAILARAQRAVAALALHTHEPPLSDSPEPA